MLVRLRSLALLVALSGCDGGAPVQSPPAPVVIAEAAPAVPAAPIEAPTTPIGWWRGEQVCFELFASGDFELSVRGQGPKVLIFGGARLTAAGPDAFVVELTVAKIWKGRWLSSCRKHHELGDWGDSQEALGVQFAPGKLASLKLRRVGDDAVELCGAQCETLRRDTPALRGRWRRAGLDNASRPDVAWAPGELLELKLADSASHLWSGAEGAQRATAYGQADARSLGDDRFEVTFTPRFFADVPPGATPTLFGAPLTVERPRILSVRRLAGERLEACDGARCGLLERQFDAYEYDVK